MLNFSFRPLPLAALIAVAAILPAASAQAQSFSVTIKNVSTDMTLKLPDGSAIKAPIAPGAYAVIRGGSLFAPGKPAGSTGLEALAEDGNPETLVQSLKDRPEVRSVGIFIPGQSFTFNAEPGDRLYFASMFVQSNDKFYAPSADGIDPFAAAKSNGGDATGMVTLWDAGTEADEQPGTGPNQAPRQSGPNSGPAENGIVTPASDGFQYPAAGDVIQITVKAG